MIKKIAHITLYTDDQDAMEEFYVDKLGFKVHTDAPYGDIRWLTLHAPEQPDVELVIFKATKPESQAQIGKQSPEGPFLVVMTDDCKGEFERLKAAGVNFIKEPTQEFWGLEALCTDPHGNIIDILQV